MDGEYTIYKVQVDLGNPNEEKWVDVYEVFPNYHVPKELDECYKKIGFHGSFDIEPINQLARSFSDNFIGYIFRIIQQDLSVKTKQLSLFYSGTNIG